MVLTSLVAQADEDTVSIETRCDYADALTKAKKFAEASAEYEELLTDDALRKAGENLDCARKGLVSNQAAQLAIDQESIKKTCELGKVYLDVDDFERATSTYQGVIDTHKDDSHRLDTSCVAEGLTRVSTTKQNLAQQYVEEGERFEESRHLEQAKNAYEAAILLKPYMLEAKKRVLQIESRQATQALDSLLVLGLEDEVLNKLKDSEQPLPAPDDVQKYSYLNRPNVPLWTEVRQTQLTDISFFSSLPAALGNLSIAGAALLLVFLWLIGRKLIWGRPTLDIGEFTTSEANASDGARFASLLEHSLMDLGKSCKGPEKILMVSGPITATPVSINQILPFSQGWAKLAEVLNKLIAWLLSKPSFMVGGEIHHATSSAGETTVAGITLNFQKGMRILDKHVIETSDFALTTDSGQLESLADIAAIWTQFSQLQTPANLWQLVTFQPRRILNLRPRRLGTSEWESYAWFTLGEKCFSDGKLEDAKLAFLQAGRIDPEFWASRVNLAGVFHFSSNGTHESLQQAFDLLRNKDPRIGWFWSGYFDPALYTGYFRRAAIAFDLYRDPGGEQTGRYSTVVRNDIDEVLKLMNSRRSVFFRWINRNLRHYLDWRIPIAESMQLGIEVITEPQGPKKNSPIAGFKARLTSATETLESKTDFYSIYNLACTYALFFEAFAEECYKKRSLNLLERAFGIAQITEPHLVTTYAFAASHDTSFNSLQGEVKSFLRKIGAKREREKGNEDVNHPPSLPPRDTLSPPEYSI